MKSQNIQRREEGQGRKPTNCNLLKGCWLLFRLHRQRGFTFYHKLAQVRETLSSPSGHQDADAKYFSVSGQAAGL